MLLLFIAESVPLAFHSVSSGLSDSCLFPRPSLYIWCHIDAHWAHSLITTAVCISVFCMEHCWHPEIFHRYSTDPWSNIHYRTESTGSVGDKSHSLSIIGCVSYKYICGWCVALQVRIRDQKVTGLNPLAGRVMPILNPWAKPLIPFSTCASLFTFCNPAIFAQFLHTVHYTLLDCYVLVLW